MLDWLCRQKRTYTSFVKCHLCCHLAIKTRRKVKEMSCSFVRYLFHFSLFTLMVRVLCRVFHSLCRERPSQIITNYGDFSGFCPPSSCSRAKNKIQIFKFKRPCLFHRISQSPKLLVYFRHLRRGV